MRTHRLVLAAVSLMASTALVSCGSDDDDDPRGTTPEAPVVADSTIASDTLPITDTVVTDTIP